MEVLAVLRDVSNTLQEDSFLENIEDFVKVKLPSRNEAATSAASKNKYHEINPSLLTRRWGIDM